MTGAEGLAAAFVGGVLTSASPCVLAAVPVAVGFVGGQAMTPRRAWWLALAFVAGMNAALLAMGLAAALALAGSGSAFGASMWWGAALLLAYGIGHSALLLVAGAMPGTASALMRRFANAQRWLPGRRSFAALLALAGLWWVAQGVAPEWTAALVA